jgi:hypothetical protein
MTAVFNDQLGAPLAMQRAGLTKVGHKLDGAGLKILVELQVLEFQFPNPNQHSSTGLSLKPLPNSPFAPAEPGPAGQAPDWKRWQVQTGGNVPKANIKDKSCLTAVSRLAEGTT